MPTVLNSSSTNASRSALPAADEFEISFFGPGYGECIVIHLGHRRWMIVDSCLDAEGRPAGIRYLKEIGVPVETDVILVVATHWHDDHIRGLGGIFAETKNARLVVSGAQSKEQFLSLVEAMKSRTFLDSTGVDEWIKIVGELKRRKSSNGGSFVAPIIAVGDRRLLKSEGPVPNEVWSLSPSDSSVFAACKKFEDMFPAENDPIRRITVPSPNHTSVVLWIEAGDARVLLGADLQETKAKDQGWTAILDSATRPRGTADVFKISHHGSENGYHADVWKKMLVKRATAALIPFSRGKTPLPTGEDIARIKSHTSDCFITADPKASTKRRKSNRTSPVDRAVLETVRSIRDVPAATGHIRLRKRDGKGWTLELFGTARAL